MASLLALFGTLLRLDSSIRYESEVDRRNSRSGDEYARMKLSSGNVTSIVILYRCRGTNEQYKNGDESLSLQGDQ
jgi:hypothetical protein